MLDQIVKVKEIRFDTAKRELAESKQHLQRCQQALEDHIQATKEYALFMKREKVRLFSEIENEEVSLKEIDNYQLEISYMKQHLAEMENKISEFEANVADAESRLSDSRKRYQKCNADLQKYEELGEEMGQNEKAALEYKEEVELEDQKFKGPQF